MTIGPLTRDSKAWGPSGAAQLDMARFSALRASKALEAERQKSLAKAAAAAAAAGEAAQVAAEADRREAEEAARRVWAALRVPAVALEEQKKLLAAQNAARLEASVKIPLVTTRRVTTRRRRARGKPKTMTAQRSVSVARGQRDREMAEERRNRKIAWQERVPQMPAPGSRSGIKRRAMRRSTPPVSSVAMQADMSQWLFLSSALIETVARRTRRWLERCKKRVMRKMDRALKRTESSVQEDGAPSDEVEDVATSDEVDEVENALVAGTVQVLVKTLKGKTITLDVAGADTGIEVKRRLEDKTGVPAELQRLVSGAKNVEDQDTLAEVGVEAGASLTMLLRLEGGALDVFAVLDSVQAASRSGMVKNPLKWAANRAIIEASAAVLNKLRHTMTYAAALWDANGTRVRHDDLGAPKDFIKDVGKAVFAAYAEGSGSTLIPPFEPVGKLTRPTSGTPSARLYATSSVNQRIYARGLETIVRTIVLTCIPELGSPLYDGARAEIIHRSEVSRVPGKTFNRDTPPTASMVKVATGQTRVVEVHIAPIRAELREQGWSASATADAPVSADFDVLTVLRARVDHDMTLAEAIRHLGLPTNATYRKSAKSMAVQLEGRWFDGVCAVLGLVPPPRPPPNVKGPNNSERRKTVIAVAEAFDLVATTRTFETFPRMRRFIRSVEADALVALAQRLRALEVAVDSDDAIRYRSNAGYDDWCEALKEGKERFAGDADKVAAWKRALSDAHIDVWRLRKADPDAYAAWKDVRQHGVDLFHADESKHRAWRAALSDAHIDVWRLRKAEPDAYAAWKAAHQTGVDAFHADPIRHAAWIENLNKVWKMRKSNPELMRAWTEAHLAGVRAFHADPVRHAAWIEKLNKVWKMRKSNPELMRAWTEAHQAGVDALHNDPVRHAEWLEALAEATWRNPDWLLRRRGRVQWLKVRAVVSVEDEAHLWVAGYEYRTLELFLALGMHLGDQLYDDRTAPDYVKDRGGDVLLSEALDAGERREHVAMGQRIDHGGGLATVLPRSAPPYVQYNLEGVMACYEGELPSDRERRYFPDHLLSHCMRNKAVMAFVTTARFDWECKAIAVPGQAAPAARVPKRTDWIFGDDCEYDADAYADEPAEATPTFDLAVEDELARIEEDAMYEQAVVDLDAGGGAPGGGGGDDDDLSRMKASISPDSGARCVGDTKCLAFWAFHDPIKESAKWQAVINAGHTMLVYMYRKASLTIFEVYPFSHPRVRSGDIGVLHTVAALTWDWDKRKPRDGETPAQAAQAHARNEYARVAQRLAHIEQRLRFATGASQATSLFDPGFGDTQWDYIRKRPAHNRIQELYGAFAALGQPNDRYKELLANPERLAHQPTADADFLFVTDTGPKRDAKWADRNPVGGAAPMVVVEPPPNKRRRRRAADAPPPPKRTKEHIHLAGAAAAPPEGRRTTASNDTPANTGKEPIEIIDLDDFDT